RRSLQCLHLLDCQPLDLLAGRQFVKRDRAVSMMNEHTPTIRAKFGSPRGDRWRQLQNQFSMAQIPETDLPRHLLVITDGEEPAVSAEITTKRHGADVGQMGDLRVVAQPADTDRPSPRLESFARLLRRRIGL